MTLSVRSDAVAETWLAAWDDRWKILGLTALAVGMSVVKTLPLAGMALGVALGVCVMARPGWFSLLGVIGLILLGTLPLAIVMPLLGPSTGAESTVVVFRGLAVGLTLYAIVASTKPDRVFQALQRLCVPRLFVTLLAFAYRFSFVLTKELKRVRVAMVARGATFSIHPKSAVLTARLAGVTLQRSRQRAETVSLAMQARGFRGRWPSHDDFQTRWWDVLLFAMSVAGAISFFAFG